jgi:hypothetical protein
MEQQSCSQCEKSKSVLTCGFCACTICKKCAQILEPESFAFAVDLSSELKHGTFCTSCYEEKVSEPLAEYLSVLETAKNIDVFYKNQGKETRLVRRKEKPVVIEPCIDRDEVVMRLAYQAALGGFDSVVDIDLRSHKVHDGGYQKQLWRGSGVPANTKGKVINTDKSIWHNPN